MNSNEPLTIWTIGHSTRSMQDFIQLLRLHQIQLLTDVRLLPGSRRYPHFNQEQLSKSLADVAIDYLHLPALGGRRRPRRDSPNTNWRNEAFRGYADYMMTQPFHDTMIRLQNLASTKRTAIMCAEAVWWQCHRALISDYLKVCGVEVMHIISKTKTESHPFTSAARLINGRLHYGDSEQPLPLD